MRKIFATLASAALAFGTLAHAEDRTPPTTAPAKTPAKQLTTTELGTMLENLGYEAVPVKNDKGEVIAWDAKILHNELNYYPRFEISPNGKFLWITGLLAQLKEGDKLPQDMYANLLEANRTTGPSYIDYNAKTKKFFVNLAVSNSQLTPAELRKAQLIYINGMKFGVSTWLATLKAAEPADVAAAQ